MDNGVEANYIDDIADAIQQEVNPDKLPTRDTRALFRLYAVLALTKGEMVTLEDIHNAWSAWMLDHDPGHAAIKPFNELRPEIQRQDQPYADAIRIVAARLHPLSG